MLEEQCYCARCDAKYSVPGYSCKQITHVCAVDGRAFSSSDPPPPPPPPGPGTFLKQILDELDVHIVHDCACTDKAYLMDVWGWRKCRRHREKIIGWLRDSSIKVHWRRKLNMARKAFQTGIAWKVNWRDPIPGLVDEAIHRAWVRSQLNTST